MRLRTPLIMLLLLMGFLPLQAVEAQPPVWVDVRVDRLYGVRGESFQVTAESNASQVQVEIFGPDDAKVYSQTWAANTSRTLPIAQDALYGTYTVRCTAGEAVSTVLFTILDVENWSPVSFPYQVSHKNIMYTFYGNWTLTARQGDDVLKVDLSTLRALADQYGMQAAPRSNQMNFLARLKRDDLGIVVDIDMAFIHSGAKLIINGTLDRPREFTFAFNLSKRGIIRYLDGLSSGGLVFDWSDIRKAGQAFTYDPETRELRVQAPQTFRIDPAIFSNGFEEGDFSAWSGTSGSPTIVGSPVHHGSYAAACDVPYEYVHRSFTAQTTVFIRYYFQLNATPPLDGNRTRLLELRGGGVKIARVYIQRYGTEDRLCLYRYYPSTSLQNAAYAFEADTWYCLEVKFAKDASAGEYRVWLDGSELLTMTGLDTSAANDADLAYIGRIGSSDSYTCTLFLDCVVIDSSYIGPESESDKVINVHVYTSDGEDVENATAMVTDNDNGDLEFSRLTNSTGYTADEVLEVGNYTLLVVKDGYLPYSLIFSFNATCILEVPLTTPEDTLVFNLETMLLAGIALIFMLITFFTKSVPLGIISGATSMVTWFATGGYWLLSQTVAPGIAMLFFGFGAVCLILTLNGALKSFNLIGRSREEEEGLL